LSKESFEQLIEQLKNPHVDEEYSNVEAYFQDAVDKWVMNHIVFPDKVDGVWLTIDRGPLIELVLYQDVCPQVFPVAASLQKWSKMRVSLLPPALDTDPKLDMYFDSDTEENESCLKEEYHCNDVQEASRYKILARARIVSASNCRNINT
jgi:hypothetical protein